MFQRGDRVIYGIHGVCDVIGVDDQRIDGKTVPYLVLEPIAQPGSRYMVPTHNPAAMGKVKTMLTRQELQQLIQSDQVRRDCWNRDEGQRKQTYRELISSGDREQIMAMVHTLYCHSSEQKAAGRKVHVCDDNFLRDAEKLLISEVSIVMDMDTDLARSYVRNCLK